MMRGTARNSGEPMIGSKNFIIITWDSCRWDSVVHAAMPTLKGIGALRIARAHGTFTYPGHMAIYQGILPHSDATLPYYNRYVRQLVKIARKGAPPGGALIEFPCGTLDIIRGFADAGYMTFGWGAVGWFAHKLLQESFDQFVFTGTHATRQVTEFIESTSGLSRPFFALINFGETHYPYLCSESGVEIPLLSPARRPISWTGEFDEEGWLAQRRCCEYLDAQLAVMISHLRTLSKPTIVVLTADHGECFGEDGMVGHGFYHPKVMEVPLAIFEVDGDRIGDFGTMPFAGQLSAREGIT
jgi:hypothetical protein